MKVFGKLRAVILVALCFGFALSAADVFGQDVGADIGGGAGIFRAKNPESKKKSTKSGTAPKTSNRTTARAKSSPSATADQIEELLDDGNGFRDSRKFAEAEDA